MTQWIALFRGINVGGNNKLPMKELCDLAEGLGFEEPKTYIQSGNMVFRSAEKSADKLEEQLAAAIHKAFGFKPIVLMRRAADLERAMKANPFAEKVSEGKQCHIYFLEGDGEYDAAAVQDLAKENEEFALKGDVFYLFAPDGVGQSKLAEKLPKYLPKRYTARNLNSVQAILELAAG